MSMQCARQILRSKRQGIGNDELEQGVHDVIHFRSVAKTMPYPKSALTPPEPKLKTQGQMMALLKERSAARAQLQWNKPVRNADDTGHQTAAGTDYEIRKTLTKGQAMYWAWHAKKLLGYSADVEIARTHCESHYLGGQHEQAKTRVAGVSSIDCASDAAEAGGAAR